MTTAILSPPKHYRKDTADHPPVVEFLLALIAYVAAGAVDFFDWFMDHQVEVKKVFVLVVIVMFVGIWAGLSMAGAR